MTRVLRPFVLIRFGRISAYIFGTFVFDIEFYLREKDFSGTKSFDLFFYDYKHRGFENPTNIQWDIMVRRKLKIYPFVSLLHRANMMIPGRDQHIVKLALDQYRSRDPKGILSKTHPKIGFSQKEILRGNEFLREIGLDVGDRFVCLNVRDSAYKNRYQSWKDWSYHNHRDSEISTYEMCVEYLADRGYWIFRMGKAVDGPFNVKHPNIIDYANTSFRSDFLDIWLSANCFFLISTDSGLDNVAKVFNRPILFVNSIGPITLMMTWIHSMTYPKRLEWRKTGELLSLTDQLEHSYSKHQEFDNLGIEIKDLSSKEITEAVIEMEKRLMNEWVDDDEDNYLQGLFWEQFTSWPKFNEYHGWIHPKAKFSSSFLKNNPEFLN